MVSNLILYCFKFYFHHMKRNDIRNTISYNDVNLCTTGYWPPRLLNTHQNYAYPGHPDLSIMMDDYVRYAITISVLNPIFKFQCQEKPENSAYFSFIHFHMTKLKGPDDSKLQFQKVGVPSPKFYNKQLD